MKKDLKQAAAERKKEQEARQAQKKTTTKRPTDDIMTAGKKKETVTFGARIDKGVASQWQAYMECNKKQGNKSTLTEKALTEYMARHKLPEDKQALYDALLDEYNS